MKKQVSISIPELCHENWDRMNPVEQGRYCSVCEKCVQDLTNKSDSEIAELYRQHNGNMCGRISNRKNRLRSIKIYFLMLISFLLFKSNQILKAANPLNSGLTNDLETLESKDQEVVKKSIKIKARVVDEDGFEIPFVNVALYQGDTVIDYRISDFEGYFEFDLDSIDRSDLSIKTSYIGYESVVLNLSESDIDLEQEVVIPLTMMTIHLTGLIIVVDDKIVPKIDPFNTSTGATFIKGRDF